MSKAIKVQWVILVRMASKASKESKASKAFQVSRAIKVQWVILVHKGLADLLVSRVSVLP